MTPGLPTDAALRAADRIMLVDPNRPTWRQPVYVRMVLREATVLEIPVDSTDSVAILNWCDRIRKLDLDG